MLVYQTGKSGRFQVSGTGICVLDGFRSSNCIAKRNLILSRTKYTKSLFWYSSEFVHEVKNEVSPHKPFPRNTTSWRIKTPITHGFPFQDTSLFNGQATGHKSPYSSQQICLSLFQELGAVWIYKKKNNHNINVSFWLRMVSSFPAHSLASRVTWVSHHACISPALFIFLEN